MNDTHRIVTLHVFEPDDLWYGNIYQLVKTFHGAKNPFIVRFDDESVYRDEGGENTIIHIGFPVGFVS